MQIFNQKISCGVNGFESPAQEYLQNALSLDDLLIINRALTPRDKDIIVAEEDGEWVCGILDAKMQCLSTLQCNQGSHMEEKH